MKKFLAIIKYLFFPFLISQAADSDFAPYIGANTVITAKAEDFNSYWIGTGNGLWVINKSTATVKHLTTANSSIPSNHVTGICVTPDENVYVATENGIMRYDGYAYLNVSTENTTLPSDFITAMVCDRNGNLWVGTKDKGIALLNNYHCNTFNTHNSPLTSNAVQSISKNADDDVLVTLANKAVVKISDSGMELQNVTMPDQNAVARKN